MYTAKDDTVRNIKTTAQNLKEDIDDMSDAIKSDMRVAANRAGYKVRHWLNSARDEVGAATDTVTQQIRSNPVQSSLAALAVGIVLGALLRR